MEQPKSPWRDLVKDPKVFLTIGGLVTFLVLTLIYGRFYNTLGIDPRDIGLDYLATLLKSVQLIVSVIGYCAVLTLTPLIVYILLANAFCVLRRRPLAVPLSDVGNYFVVSSVIVVLVVAAVLVLVADQAYKDAIEVRKGRPLTYIRIGPFLLEAPVRADPAFIEPATATQPTASQSSNEKSSDAAKSAAAASAIQALRGRMLIYLGQANSVLVLYDSESRQAIYLPASQVVLRVGHCQEQSSSIPGCENAY